MGYCFCLGPSGAGKSTALHREMIRRGQKALDQFDFAQNFMIIVPDQYTMQTQKDLVLAAGDRGGIMNVDVLSFGRLSHRIFEEVGEDPRSVLDDMGKTLLIRRLVSSCKKNLKVLGRRMDHPGIIEEVKSVLSEFMQYDISPAMVEELSRYAKEGGQGGLSARLQDLSYIYAAFLEDKKERFITGEETLDLLAKALPASELIKNSVVVLDGFTGFTPVQYRVILSLLLYAKEVIFSLDYAADGGSSLSEIEEGAPLREEDLFYLTKKTVRDIVGMAERYRIPRKEDLILGGETKVPLRFQNNPGLAHLERSLFRYPLQAYQGSGEDLPIHVFAASSPSEEVRQMCIRIRTLIKEKGYHFGDFGVVTGDLTSYEDDIRVYAARYDIPVYIDSNRAILQNPLTETIRGGLEIGAGDYSYETVFRFLRCGLCGISPDEIDRLENYCLMRGIATRRRWEEPFDEPYEKLRTHVLGIIKPLVPPKESAAQRTQALYEFLIGIHAGERMEEAAADFSSRGDTAKAMEYSQIYGAVIHLLDELYSLLGEESISSREFAELVEAGFSEIRLGVLPQQVDRVLAGDMERTRLSEGKVLMVLGANDGNIPKGTSRGGLLSDLDREFLKDAIFLSPTPREQMYIQRLYLYMNMTKPTDELYVSYCERTSDGSSIRPSYLIGLLKQLYPSLRTEYPENESIGRQLVAGLDAEGFLAHALRDYGDGFYLCDQKKTDELLTVYGFLVQGDKESARRIRSLRDAAFCRYTPSRLSKEVSEKLYGRSIRGSVTRLEVAAQCYLRHFLQYGLRLKERDEFTFEARDSGAVLHESIQRFGELLSKEGLSWRSFSKQEGNALCKRALKESAGEYNNRILYATQRDTAFEGRLLRILNRSVLTMQQQLLAGDFVPAAFEEDFGAERELCYPLSGGGELLLQGRIDRVDLKETKERILVKIVDYKSGNRDLNREKIREGLQLQLILYMMAEVIRLKKKNPDRQIVPAALFYCHFGDPVFTGEDGRSIDKTWREEGWEAAMALSEDKIRLELRPKGMFCSEEEVISSLDSSLSPSQMSLAAPIKRNKDGSLYNDRQGRAYSLGEYEELTQDVQNVICALAEDILMGRTDANPARLQGTQTSCTYCPYRNVCGFDIRIPGYGYRESGEKKS